MTEYIVKCKECVRISGATMQFPEYIDMNQEIIRCRDCRFSLAHGNGCGRTQDIYDAEPNGYCSWACRKEQE